MNKTERLYLDEIIDTFGKTEVNLSSVIETFGSEYQKVLTKYGKRLGNRLYSLEEIDLTTNEEKVEPEQSKKVTEFFHNEDLVPKVDPLYVEFGCYRPIYNIVKSNNFLPFYITGESGNGKTLGVEQACANAGRELVCCNVTNETSEEDLMGSFILDNGNMIWKDGPVLVAMRRGAVLLLDEIDQATTNIMCLQTVLQNKPYYVKKTNEMVYPKPGFTVVGTANTKGDGDGSDRFAGANVLNEAFLERFNGVFEQEYPGAKIELKILQNISVKNNFLVNLVRWAGMIRENYKNGSIERCITTRRLVQIVKNYEVFNNEQDAIKYAINRFEKGTRDAMIDYYNTLNTTSFNDGLDAFLDKPKQKPETTKAKPMPGVPDAPWASTPNGPWNSTPAPQKPTTPKPFNAPTPDATKAATNSLLEKMNAYTSNSSMPTSNNPSMARQTHESTVDYIKRLKSSFNSN